jgi:hypothetical protein
VSLPLAAAGLGLTIVGIAIGAALQYLLQPEEVEEHVEMHIVDEEPDPDVAMALGIWIAENSGEAGEYGGISN